MSDELRKTCRVDLSFPLDGQRDAAARLRAVADFMERRGFGDDGFYACNKPGTAVRELETRVAALLGLEDAAWFPSGVMAQGAAARVWAERSGRRAVGLHPNSHLEGHEEFAYREAHGLESVSVAPSPDSVVTAAAVREAAPRCGSVFVELPQRENGGLLPSWEELAEVKLAAREAGAALHMDGARLWGCRPHFGGRSYAEICEGFDSVYVSLYKDVGALAGAVLAGPASFVDEARVWRRRLGGTVIRTFPEVPDALRLLDGAVDGMEARVARARELYARLERVEGLTLQPAGGPHTNMFHVHVAAPPEAANAARDAAARETGVWLAGGFRPRGTPGASAAEISMGPVAVAAPLDDLVRGFEALARALPGRQ